MNNFRAELTDVSAEKEALVAQAKNIHLLEAAEMRPSNSRTLSLSGSDDGAAATTGLVPTRRSSVDDPSGMSLDGRRTSSDNHRSVLRSLSAQTRKVFSGLRRLGSSLKSPRAVRMGSPTLHRSGTGGDEFSRAMSRGSVFGAGSPITGCSPSDKSWMDDTILPYRS